MTRCAVFVSCVGAFCLGITATASAEPIIITGGSLVFSSGALTQFGPISLTGTRGFSLQGGVDSGESGIAGLGFGFPPGSTLSLQTELFGSALVTSNVTLDGQTYQDVNHVFSPVQVDVNLFGTVELPARLVPSVVVTAPFTVSGSFTHIFEDLSQTVVPIRGSGTYSLSLAGANGVWDSRGVRYDFASTPTPEPATLTLVAGGLVAAAIRARKRRDRSTTIQLSTSAPTA